MLNRRDLLTRLSALGLLAATPEPVRRFWQLDQTMVKPQGAWGEFGAPGWGFDKIPVHATARWSDGEQSIHPITVLNDGTWQVSIPYRGQPAELASLTYLAVPRESKYTTTFHIDYM